MRRCERWAGGPSVVEASSFSRFLSIPRLLVIHLDASAHAPFASRESKAHLGSCPRAHLLTSYPQQSTTTFSVTYPFKMAPMEKGFSWSNIAVGATMNMFEVTTLGQPLEVLKTQMAANRSQSMYQAFQTVMSRGGITGFYQGLIPWAWIEASTKGGVLLFASGEIEKAAQKTLGVGPAVSGLLGGMGGGVAQAYATMGQSMFH